MNLVIDIGNTSVKLAVFNQNEILEKKVVKSSQLVSGVKGVLKQFPQIRKCIISSVGKLHSKQIDSIKKNLEFTLLLNHTTKLPFKNLYKTPTTLGVDRLALVSASAVKYPKQNVLIIDAGTCITYDFINANNDYLGGAISPGIGIRYKSLNALTANLPLLTAKQPSIITGNTTESSIHSGVINGVLKEIEGVIQEYTNIHKDLTVIFTGGDANFLSKQLKSSIFANSNFLLEGLNFILDYNSN